MRNLLETYDTGQPAASQVDLRHSICGCINLEVPTGGSVKKRSTKALKLARLASQPPWSRSDLGFNPVRSPVISTISPSPASFPDMHDRYGPIFSRAASKQQREYMTSTAPPHGKRGITGHHSDVDVAKARQ